MERVFAIFPRLKERRVQVAGTLSGGEQQMLAIGRALMARPRLLLLDEPSMGLAPVIVEQIFDTVQDINRQGVTILLVEQNAAMALAIAGRGYVLETGGIVLEGAARELPTTPRCAVPTSGRLSACRSWPAGGTDIVLILTRRDLQRLLSPADVIGAVETACQEAAAGQVRALPRAMLPMTGGGIFLSMVASLSRRCTLGTKLVTWVPGNKARRLPTIHGLYLLTDATTGVPLALMEAGFLTAIRTGAASALASRHLARTGARSVACFGAGVQAEFQLRCLQAVRPIDRVTVVGRSPARARDFAARMRRALRVPVTVTTDRSAAVRDADVVVCATTATTPVFRGRDLRPGAHVDAVGNFLPHAREVDTEGVRRAPRGGGHVRGRVDGGGRRAHPHPRGRAPAPARGRRARRGGQWPEAGPPLRSRDHALQVRGLGRRGRRHRAARV